MLASHWYHFTWN